MKSEKALKRERALLGPSLSEKPRLEVIRWRSDWGCPGVPVHEGIPFVFITIHGVMTQFVNVSFLCVPVHEDTTDLSACGDEDNSGIA